MALTPTISDAPRLDLVLAIQGSENTTDNLGRDCDSFEWRASLNGGYAIRVKLHDANFNILKKFLVEQDYFRLARSSVVEARFRLSWPDTDNSTPWQTANVTSLHATGQQADIGDLAFTAIDPPSWFLNCGDASGKAYRGKVSDVIEQCVREYAPTVSLDITETTDAEQNVWHMMRQDPKTFITSLLDWSSAITPRRGQWLIDMNGDSLRIKEQLEIISQNVGAYSGPQRVAGGAGNVSDWEMLTDNALSLLGTKLAASGLSATAGQYFDRITDTDESQVFAKDLTTPNKYKASVDQFKAFAKPSDEVGSDAPQVGWSAINAVPEIYSAGEIGKPYSTYVDGRARQLYLSLLNLVQRVRFQIQGHGIYSDCRGLGANTITLDWLDVEGRPFFLAGNWILYGWAHRFKPGVWLTHLYCARLDYDALAVAVPGPVVEPGV